MAEQLRASRCPRCRRLVVPPASICPDHPVRMVAALLPPLGEVVSFTTLHSPPEGFRAPLHLALVDNLGAGNDGTGVRQAQKSRAPFSGARLPKQMGST